jgi:hydroxyacylglutathione hydrolase
LLGIRFDVIDVPGHTAGHIAYIGRPAGQSPILFCGDTLFAAGCGRLFEGTPAQMHASLSALAALPADSRVCCAHEYTLSNLKFARAVEPGSADLVDELARCEALRARSQPTLPSSVGRERLTNPFLRCDQPAVIAAARHAGAASAAPVDVFAALRAWKNTF